MRSETATSSQVEAPAKLSIGEKVGYGLGDTASNLYWKLFENFQLFFYTNVFGIDAGSAGTMFFVTKIWDAINDPIFGFLADRTKSAWGRFRPWLLWMIVPFVVTGMLTFYTPDFSENGKLIYAYITYTLVFMAYTAINIPYGALMGVISSSPSERTSVSTFRFVLAFAGGLVVQKCTEPLVAYFGRQQTVDETGAVTGTVVNVQIGFFWTVACYACLAAVLFVICFLTTKERVSPEQAHRASFGRDVLDLLGNRPWMVLLFVGLFQILAGWTRGSAVPYYFTYYVNSSFGNFLVAGTVASILGMLFTRPLTDLFGKKRLMILSMTMQVLLTAGYYLVTPSQMWLVYALHIVASFVGGPMPVLLWAMYADVADYSEWKYHRRATALVFAAATFAQKLGGALGGAVPGWCLAFYGFQKPLNNELLPQTETTIYGIVLMMSIIPAGFLAVGALCMAFYGIDHQFLRTIEADLAERKSIGRA